MKINNTEIVDTFAEAFGMRYSRIIVTAADRYWLDAGLHEFTGYGTSVIGCDAEVGIERYLADSETPDGRPGASVLAFAFNDESIADAVTNRCGQCLMTCPSTAVYNGLVSDKTFALGKKLRFFGDGYQKSKLIDDRRFWRIPVMDGEFVVEEQAGIEKGIAGGNILIQSRDQKSGLAAARRSIDAIFEIPGVITPFPGGVVRSGSKVGSRYDGLLASTSHTYCPSLRGRVDSEVHVDANCVYEIVIDGCDTESIERAMIAGIQASVSAEVLAISAGNYGGNLGKHQFFLQRLIEKAEK